MGTKAFRVTLLLGLLAGCSSSASSGTVNGNLGQGTFSYKCVDPSDAACKTSSSGPLEFPGSIAEGAQFRLAYATSGDEMAAGNPTLRAVSKDYLISAADTFTAVKSGFGAVVAKSTSTGLVLDYTLIKINPVGSLRLTDIDGSFPPPTVTLAKAMTKDYDVAALGMHGETLDGTLGYAWTSSDASIVTLQHGNPSARMKILTGTPGTATLTVTLGAQTKSIAITVTP